MTPKQRRTRGKPEQPDADEWVRFQPPLLESDFDEEQADAEFSRWRPEHGDVENI